MGHNRPGLFLGYSGILQESPHCLNTVVDPDGKGTTFKNMDFASDGMDCQSILSSPLSNMTGYVPPLFLGRNDEPFVFFQFE